MSDEVLNIKVTATEIDLIMDALHAFEPDGSGWEGQDLHELADDLREQFHRHNDEWNDPEDPDLLMDQIVICDAEINAETQMFNAGVEAREKIKATATSRAQDRRTFNMKRNRDSRLSETQTHDVWDDCDPKNW